jgi:hypothetical protein
MSLVVALILLAVLAAPLVFSILRSTELFVVRASAGKFELVRGRMPPALKSELDDIARRNELDGAEVRAIVEGGAPRLLFKGSISAGAEQQLRNVVGRFRLVQLRGGSLRPR